MDNVERVKTVYFELYSKELSREEIEEPKGWNEDFLAFKKDKKSKDIRKEVEIDLEFYGRASNYLRTLYYNYGVATSCFLIKYEISTTGIEESWDLAYVQRIDLSTFDIENETGKVQVKAYEGGLYDLIENRFDDEMDLMDDFSLDGEYIGPIKTHPFQASERKIFLKSLLQGDFNRYRIGTGYWKNQWAIHSARPIPFEIIYKSDAAGDIQVPILVDPMHNEGRSRHAPLDPVIDFPVEIDLPFFFEAEESKMLKIELQGTFQITEFEERHAAHVDKFYVRYVKSYRGLDGLQKQGQFINIKEIDISSNVGSIIEVNWSGDIQLEEGESISLVYATEIGIDRPNIFAESGYANVWVNSDMAITVEDVTIYPPRVAEAIKPIDWFDRIVAKITGKTGLVKSEAFGPGGDMEYMVLNNGFMARGFPHKYLNEKGEEIAFQINTSFKDAMDSFSGITPMAWLTQKEGNKEIVRVEPEIYTLGNFIGVRFESVDDVREKSSKNDLFSKIVLGHEGDLNYEEVNGLNEPNGKSNFATHLGVAVNNTYSKISKYRYDPMGYELIRRISFDKFPHQDTPRDEDIWIIDGKLQGGIIVNRHWTDDFAAMPQGIFDPDSAWNLRFSPMNLLLRGHGYAVRRCLHHNTNNLIRFAGSNANQNLITFPEENFTLKESGEIIIHKLPKQRIKADIVTMTVKVTPEIRKQLEGVNENGVKNVFGLVEYVEDGVKKYGRIVKINPGESSKLELIKAGI